MQKVVVLAAVAALLCAGQAAAASSAVHHGQARARGAIVRVRQAGRLPHRRLRRLHAVARAAEPAAASPHAALADAGGAEATSRPGWFKADREAGWGVSRGGTRTMVGLYQRPAQPDIPGPQIYHEPEGRGAAGLSLSFKLGH